MRYSYLYAQPNHILISLFRDWNFSQAFQPWNPHLSIYLYIDLVHIWSWLDFSGNFAMICMGNIFTLFNLVQFCLKQFRQNSWAKWRFFPAVTGEKICLWLNVSVLIWQSFDFGTIISWQMLEKIVKIYFLMLIRRN